MVGLEPTRCCHQRILSPHRLPFRHTGVRIAFILYYAAFVKSSVFCPQNAKKTISGLFSARRRAGLCRRGALPVSAVQRDSRRGLPVPAAQRDSRRGLLVPAAQRDSRRGCRFRQRREIHGGRRRFRLCKEIHGGGCRFRLRKEIHGGGCRFRLCKEIHGGGCRSKLPIVKNAAAGGIRF